MATKKTNKVSAKVAEKTQAEITDKAAQEQYEKDLATYNTAYEKYQTDLENANIDFQKQTKEYQSNLQNWEKEKNKFIKAQDELKANFSNLIRTDIKPASVYYVSVDVKKRIVIPLCLRTNQISHYFLLCDIQSAHKEHPLKNPVLHVRSSLPEHPRM